MKSKRILVLLPGLLLVLGKCGGDGETGGARNCADAGNCGGGGTGGAAGVDSGRGGSAGSVAGSGAAMGGGSGGALGNGGASGVGGAGSGGTAGSSTSCGNGSLEPPEECDTGSASATCDADCTKAVCGDGTVNPLANEQCDTVGGSADCDPDCTYRTCGDAIVHTNAGEACDAHGESATCDIDCTPAACGDGITNVAAGERCDDGNSSGGDGCSSLCTFESAAGNGDTCAGAIPIALGANSVSWTATTNNYFAWRPPCSQGGVSGPDVVLSYTASFTGELEVRIPKPDSNQWVALVNSGVCGDTSAPLACIARGVGTEMTGRVPVVNGSTYYFYVADTTFGASPLSNPFTITLGSIAADTGENCSSPIAVGLGKNTVRWTASQQDVLFQPPSCTRGATIEAPDIALSYVPAFDGYVGFEISKPNNARWVVVANDSPCGALSSPLGCTMNDAGASLNGLLGVTDSFTAPSDADALYLLIANTRQAPIPLSNPLSITLTGMDQAGGTGETCTAIAKQITLGANRVMWTASVNDHLTATPSCTGGRPVRGPDAVFEYIAPTSGTLGVTVDKPAATRWVAVVNRGGCGSVQSPLACISDFSSTRMHGSLPVTGGFKYYVYVAATDEGQVPLLTPLTITLSQ